MGGDLDQLAANYNVKRLTVTPADNDAVPPVAAVMESDEALRLRVPAAFEGLSVAGPTAAYEFHAKSTDGRVADASATSPAPAEVVLTVLSREGDGTAAADLLAVVEQALNSENVRPVADRLTVRSAEIIPYSVDATIFLYPGPEAEPVMEAAKASLRNISPARRGWGAIFAAVLFMPRCMLKVCSVLSWPRRSLMWCWIRHKPLHVRNGRNQRGTDE